MVLDPDEAGLVVCDENFGSNPLGGLGDALTPVSEELGADYHPGVLQVLWEVDPYAAGAATRRGVRLIGGEVHELVRAQLMRIVGVVLHQDAAEILVREAA